MQVGIDLVTENNYRAQSPDGREITIMNGERCEVAAIGRDFLDLRFLASRVEEERLARVIHEGDAMPEGFAFGYAMSVHKAQGSQFQHVIVVTAPGGRFVQRPSLYTAISRARQSLTIVGDEDEFWSAAIKDASRRTTLLSMFGLNGD
jgi:ATP-dependent exoDNAse (exonuclease V) alpha subunit